MTNDAHESQSNNSYLYRAMHFLIFLAGASLVAIVYVPPAIGHSIHLATNDALVLICVAICLMHLGARNYFKDHLQGLPSAIVLLIFMGLSYFLSPFKIF